jgi:membrane protein implicated in regulation of membrane protease activity
MLYFYLGVTIIAAALLITDVVLRYMEKIKSLGIEQKLFRFKGETIPIEKFLPQSVTMVLGCLLTAGVSGVILDLIGFRWYLSMPFAVMTGLLVCFVLQEPLQSAVAKYKDKIVPRGDKAAGVQGFAYEDIEGDDYGLIEFEFNDLTFRAPAVSVNGTAIPEFEKVIILFEQDGCFFVQSIKEVFEALNE